jgi:hypothetical protein
LGNRISLDSSGQGIWIDNTGAVYANSDQGPFKSNLEGDLRTPIVVSTTTRIRGISSNGRYVTEDCLSDVGGSSCLKRLNLLMPADNGPLSGFAVNADGVVIGQSYTGSGSDLRNVPFVSGKNGAAAAQLLTVGEQSHVWAINDLGQVVGTVARGANEGDS